MTAKKPLVSILMPYYKLGDYLKEAADSVRAQTYENWELIVVDDGSPECPASEVLASTKDARIKIFRQNPNQGIAPARNLAASHSQGELFLPLDADDLLSPEYIDRTLKAMNESNAVAAYTDVQIFGIGSGIYKPTTDLAKIFGGHYPHNTLLFKRELFDTVGGYKHLEAVIDTEFWISIIELGKPFAYIPEPLYHYRRHQNSFTQKKGLGIGRAFYKALLLHQETMAEHISEVLELWMQIDINDGMERAASCDTNAQYAHLQSEYKTLQERYESLEKLVKRNESKLDSMSQVARQISYLGLKRLGMR